MAKATLSDAVVWAFKYVPVTSPWVLGSARIEYVCVHLPTKSVPVCQTRFVTPASSKQLADVRWAWRPSRLNGRKTSPSDSTFLHAATPPSAVSPWSYSLSLIIRPLMPPLALVSAAQIWNPLKTSFTGSANGPDFAAIRPIVTELAVTPCTAAPEAAAV